MQDDINRKTGPKRRPLWEKFWEKVDKSDEAGCWIWTGSRTRGYGSIGIGSLTDGTRRTIGAHRISYMLTYGPYADDLSIDHLCRNPLCVRPDHLEAVPIGVNVLRGLAPSAQNKRKTHCKYGHEFTPENTIRVPKGRECRLCRQRRDRERYRRNGRR